MTDSQAFSTYNVIWKDFVDDTFTEFPLFTEFHSLVWQTVAKPALSYKIKGLAIIPWNYL